MLTVAYDGTNYHGWQCQKNHISIQETIEKAASSLFNQEIKIIGAGRTDSGVHALGQRASFKIDTSIPVDKIPYALNPKLPKDIIITEAQIVHDDFHPRYNAISKVYEYKIQNSRFQLPTLRNYCEFVPNEIDFLQMKKCCEYIIGTKDFKSFCSSGSNVKTTIRTVFDLNVTKSNDIITIIIEGNGFLYNMVRIIAGLFIDVGLGKIMPSDIEGIILSKNRCNARRTAAACGLTLLKVNYK